MIVTPSIECAKDIVETYKFTEEFHKEMSIHFVDIKTYLYKKYKMTKSFWFKKSEKKFFDYYFGVTNPKMGDFFMGRRLREFCESIDSSGLIFKQLSVMYYTMYSQEFNRVEILVNKIDRYSKFEETEVILDDNDLAIIDRLNLTYEFLKKIKEMQPQIMEIICETLNMDENGPANS